jgi:hypothetical protein
VVRLSARSAAVPEFYRPIHRWPGQLRQPEDINPPGPTLLQACRRYGIQPTIDEAHKEQMRELAWSKTDQTPEEIADLQDYCLADDCQNTMNLFLAMRDRIDFLRAPIRGAYMMELERVRWRGIPIDAEIYDRAVRQAPKAAAAMRAEQSSARCRSLFP